MYPPFPQCAKPNKKLINPLSLYTARTYKLQTWFPFFRKQQPPPQWLAERRRQPVAAQCGVYEDGAVGAGGGQQHSQLRGYSCLRYQAATGSLRRLATRWFAGYWLVNPAGYDLPPGWRQQQVPWSARYIYIYIRTVVIAPFFHVRVTLNVCPPPPQKITHSDTSIKDRQDVWFPWGEGRAGLFRAEGSFFHSGVWYIEQLWQGRQHGAAAGQLGEGRGLPLLSGEQQSARSCLQSFHRAGISAAVRQRHSCSGHLCKIKGMLTRIKEVWEIIEVKEKMSSLNKKNRPPLRERSGIVSDS